MRTNSVKIMERVLCIVYICNMPTLCKAVLSYAPLPSLMKKHTITITPYAPETPFHFKPFPLSLYPHVQNNSGTFAATYVAHIQNGTLFGTAGCVLLEDKALYESVPEVDHKSMLTYLRCVPSNKTPRYIDGSVLTITSPWCYCYFHWITEVLVRLLLAQHLNISFDFVFVPYSKPFMKETLTLLGIEPQQIIQPMKSTSFIQAKQLIMPSYPARKKLTHQVQQEPSLAFYCQPFAINALRCAFLPHAVTIDHSQWSKKIYISRKDAKLRTTINEDAVYELFKPFGFESYCLSNMSFLEQVALFHNATHIVATHGAGLTNILFCNPGTKLFEIFQNRSDCTYFYLSQQLKMWYAYLKTTEFTDMQKCYNHTTLPLDFVQRWIEKNKDHLNAS